MTALPDVFLSASVHALCVASLLAALETLLATTVLLAALRHLAIHLWTARVALTLPGSRMLLTARPRALGVLREAVLVCRPGPLSRPHLDVAGLIRWPGLAGRDVSLLAADGSLTPVGLDVPALLTLSLAAPLTAPMRMSPRVVLLAGVVVVASHGYQAGRRTGFVKRTRPSA